MKLKGTCAVGDQIYRRSEDKKAELPQRRPRDVLIYMGALKIFESP